jgi:hypothetical protein
MTMAELMAALSTAQERIWLISQYWTSVSFGLIIAAYVVSKKLHIVMMTTVLVFYVAFTVFCASLARQAIVLCEGIFWEIQLKLDQLEANGEALDNIRRGFDEGFEYYNLSIANLAFGGLFFTVIAFVTYSQYRLHRRSGEL